MKCYRPIEIGPNRFPCGKCNFCLESKRADWSFRLAAELKTASTAKFITLTYTDENLPLGENDVPSLCKGDVQSFVKRLRFAQSEITQDRIRYYTVGEYGSTTLRPHYHSIMFNLDLALVPRVEALWQKGAVHFGKVTPASIHYTTKYVVNRHGDFHGREPPFFSYVTPSGDWFFLSGDAW